MAKSIPAAVLIAVLGVGAAPAQQRIVPYPIFPEPGWAAAVAAGTRTAGGAPGPKYWTNAARYRIDAELLPATAELRGHAVMTYVNRSPRRLDHLVVHLRQNIHRRDAIRRTPVEITGGMNVTGVRVLRDGEAPRAARRGVSGTIMNLQEAVDPGQEVTLEMDWSFQVPRAGSAPRMGHEEHHVFFLGYWYPQFAVCEDVAGWVADPYLGEGEFYMGYADYEVAITVPHGWLVRATGDLVNPEEVLTAAVRERLEQAAGSSKVINVATARDRGPGRLTPESPTGSLTWRFRAENVRDVAISASDRYLWDAVAAKIPAADGAGPERAVLVDAVYEPDATAWKRGAEYCRHTVEFLSRELYPYPWRHMTACEGVVGGGMEYPMMTVVGSIGSPVVLHSIVAHETIHMWFPMIVGSNEARWAWMDEGLTDFFTDRCTEDFDPKSEAGSDTLRGYRLAARSVGEVEAMRHADCFPADHPGAYEFVSYTKTAAVLHQLRAMIGEQRFREAMRTYVRRWAFRHPYPRDFFATFAAAAGEDLDWYFRTWLYETWTLDQRIAAVDPGPEGTVVTVEDLGPATGPTVVEATYADGHKDRKTVPVRTWLEGAIRAEVPFGAGVTAVRLDPDGTTLDIDLANNVWPRK